MSKKIFFIFLFLISCLYFFLRLYKLDDLIGFRLDQGIHLLETKSMFDQHQLRLIGPMVTSKSIDGRNFFIGGNYYYVLAIIGLVSSWNPLTITIIFIIIEYLFYLLFIFFLQKNFHKLLSLTIFLFITISPYLIIHSRFFWNPHLLIPLSILVIINLHQFVHRQKFLNLFLASFFWGFAFACHYTSLFWVIFFVYFLIKTKKIINLKSYIILLFGFFIGNLPFFIFEFRHQFYNLKTIFYIFTHSSQGSQLTSHYFVFSLLIFIIYFLIISLPKKSRFFLLSSILIFITLIQFLIFKNYSPLDTISGWNYSAQQQVATIISQNCPSNFNIATTMQGDTRSYDLRFLLNLKKCFPNSIDQYPSSQILFLVAPISRPPETETVWEVSSFKPFKIQQQTKLNDNLILYQLIKN